MASSSRTHISFRVFSLVLLFSSLHIHGRDSKFFDKVTHLSPSPSPSPSPAPAEPESQNGYGLFGRDSSDENGTPSDGLGGDRYPNYNTGYTNTNNEELTGESLMSTNYEYNSGNEKQGTSESWIMDNGRYYYGSTPPNTDNQGLTGESLMSNNNDLNGYTATYTTDLYQPDRQRSNDDNYVGGYEKGTTSDGNYYGNNVKYEFDSMEEYDKYQQKKGGYWP